MQRDWEPEELIAGWTLVEEDQRLVGNKTAASRLGFALLLKYFELEGRFPESREELPQAAVEYVAGLVGVDSSALAKYAWSGRTIEYHRAQIRGALGFRECSEADEDRLASWLAEEVCPVELARERLREALLARSGWSGSSLRRPGRWAGSWVPACDASRRGFASGRLVVSRWARSSTWRR